MKSVSSIASGELRVAHKAVRRRGSRMINAWSCASESGISSSLSLLRQRVAAHRTSSTAIDGTLPSASRSSCSRSDAHGRSRGSLSKRYAKISLVVSVDSPTFAAPFRPRSCVCALELELCDWRSSALSPLNGRSARVQAVSSTMLVRPPNPQPIASPLYRRWPFLARPCDMTLSLSYILSRCHQMRHSLRVYAFKRDCIG